MKIPEAAHTTVSEIYKLYEKRTEKPRQYLGWSQIGRSCERELWLAFRFAFNPKFDGRMLRLFDTGFREEARIISELRDIGYTVECIDRSTGKQIAVSSLGGHFRGHVDAVVTGFPEDPKTKHLMDVKTIKTKKFDELLKSSMKKMYPAYWAQAHGYMGKLGLKKAVYIFVCKDDDRIHLESFDFDQTVFDKYEKRAEAIIFSDRMPPPISTDPSWYECKMCTAHDLCHVSKLTKNVNCRTCANSTAERDGTWSCAHYDATIPDFDAQMNGCDAHVLHPDLVPWQHKVENDKVIWITPEGNIANGVKSSDTFASTEIVANWKACASPDEFIKTLRNDFDGKIF